MAKASWASVNPSSGSGNGSVAVSSTAAHTGRVARTTTLTITAANVDDRTVTVNQAGKEQYVSGANNATAVKDGQNVTISGMSNARALTFTLGTGTLSVSLPSSYSANTINTANGANIVGDPGAAAEYSWSIVITVPANTSTSDRSRQIIMTDEAGHTSTCLLTQTAGNAYLFVFESGQTTGTVELTAAGTAVSFNVISNTSWEIS